MEPQTERGLALLVLVNVALQVLDGLATYLGLRAGLGEANPLVAWAIGSVGPTQGLLLFKLEACACLLALWTLRRSRLAVPGLALTAAVYAACSLGPWAAALARVHLAS